MNLSYTRIYYFLTIVKYMNMKKAAEELFISQPALSLSIAKLEEELGVTLLHRDRSKLVLSSEAKKLLPYFEQIRHDFNALDAVLAEIKHPGENYITVSFSGSTHAFSHIYTNGIVEQYKDAIVKLCFVDPNQAREMLLTEQAQFAVTYPPIKHPMITSELIFEEPIGVVIPATHPMAKMTKLETSDICALQFHGYKKNHLFRRVVDTALSAHGVYPKYSTECNYTDYVDHMCTNDQINCFFSTEQNYRINFTALGDYLYLPVNCAELVRSVGLSHLTKGEAQYKYPDLLQLLKKETIKTYTQLNAVTHCDLLKHRDSRPKQAL